MLYQILVQAHPGRNFTASVLGVADCVAEGPTKEEAIANASNALAERLAQGEVVTIKIDARERRRNARIEVVPAPVLFGHESDSESSWKEVLATKEKETQEIQDSFGAPFAWLFGVFKQLFRQDTAPQRGGHLEIDAENAASGKPWLKNFGRMRDDPTFDDFMAEIEAHRRPTTETE
jgi:predicted RNase H-like HicB family nuclease